MPLHLQPLAQLYQEYLTALDALQDMGVRIDGTRLARYSEILDRAIIAEQSELTEHQQDNGFLNAIIEAVDITDIAALNPNVFQDGEVLRKLRQVSDGREFMSVEGSDRARDYAFEFSAAAALHRKNQFGGFSPNGGDITVGRERWPAECKRLSSLNRLEQRLRKARTQLDGQQYEFGGPPGVIVIDLTKPIRFAQGPINSTTEDELEETAESHLTAYIARYFRPQWIEMLASPATLGIMIRYISVGTVVEASSVRRCTVWQAISLHGDDMDENSTFMQIADCFGPGPLRNITTNEISEATHRTVIE